MDKKEGKVIPIKSHERRYEEAVDALEVFQERMLDAVVEAYASPLTFEAMAATMVRFVATNYLENALHKDPYGFIVALSMDLLDEYEATVASAGGDGDNV